MNDLELEQKLGIKPQYFGSMLPYILDDDVTDVEWDGSLMKIDNLKTGQQFIDIILEEEFCDKFAKRVSDAQNESYNESYPTLYTETSTLRITILHPSVSINGTNINLRKIEAKLRMSLQSIIESGYCDEITLKLLEAFIKSRLSGILIGGTGTGKTELLKFLAQWIPEMDTIVSIEDTNELKLKQIYPKKFVRATFVRRHYTWGDGILYALRANASWLLMAEARAEEVVEVLEIASTSCAIVTCIHAKSVRQIPDRIDNMIGAGVNGIASKENDVFTFFDFAIKINKENIKGSAPLRTIDELCVFERIGKENKIHMIIEGGKLTGIPLPNSLVKELEKNHIEDPLKTFIESVDMK